MVIGIIIGMLLIVSYGWVFYLGYKFADKSKVEVVESEDKEREKQVARLRDEGFQNIMDYDINVALGRGDLNE